MIILHNLGTEFKINIAQFCVFSAMNVDLCITCDNVYYSITFYILKYSLFLENHPYFVVKTYSLHFCAAKFNSALIQNRTIIISVY